MASKAQLTTLRAIFRAWHVGSAISTAHAQATATRRQQQLQRRCLGAWKATCHAAAEAAKHAEAMHMQRQQATLCNAVRSWRAAAAGKRRRVHRIQSCRSNAHRRQLAAAFDAWRTHCHVQKVYRRKVQLVQGKAQQSLQEKAFVQLRQAAQERVAHEAAVRRAGAWQRRRLLRGCLAALQHKVQAAVHMRANADDVLAERRLHTAFRCWRVQAGRARSAQQLASTHCDVHVMQRALRTWQAAKTAANTRRQLHRRAAAKSSRALKCKALAAWLQVVTMQSNDSFGARAIHRSGSELSDSPRSRHLLVASWRAWKAHALATAIGKRRMVHAAAKANRLLQARALKAWLTVMQLQAHHQCTAQQQREQTVLAAALRSWRRVAVLLRSRRERAQAAVKCSQQSLLRAVVREWHAWAAARYRSARRQALVQQRRNHRVLR